ncbi:hypothetical protein HMPREF9336_04378 [Segniliparus rugosus ATCC BAA-974]|uniref:Sulfatase N-terminal domain-containing protein n=1 Tax=Segniliparus rugosus (strain ATCC BAA-974 / DSM 45345 / CCUG 50838 / CIP 108380 / JCM 13579 / CDC 945) TaxID=679197 RepID=U1N4X4_SEGRC|nr:sulfatase-like hydrolase/transferase [Segniliparus rugosus]ERG69234.1 hypothetical protein HMPREF9336_04378 [Segniliparus rugosus ATCC BAA-974]
MEIDRRGLLGLSAVALALGAAACDTSRSPSGASGAGRRSVLLVIADDHGSDMSSLGVPVRTPELDKLAQEGTFFTEGYATVSSCSSSRSTMFTGLYSHTNGMYGLAHDVHNFSLLDGVETISEMMQRSGFATALVGKKHVKPMAFGAELAPEETGNRDVARLARAAGGWLREQAGKPFLLVVGFSDPHRAPGGFGNTRDWPEVPTVRYAPSEVQIPSHLPDLPQVREDLADYYQSVSRMDAGVGLLLDELKKPDARTTRWWSTSATTAGLSQGRRTRSTPRGSICR